MKALDRVDNYEFLLPDDIGWRCNDEISDYIDKWARKLPKVIDYGTWQVAKGELMDNIYALIKKYQKKDKP